MFWYYFMFFLLVYWVASAAAEDCIEDRINHSYDEYEEED